MRHAAHPLPVLITAILLATIPAARADAAEPTIEPTMVQIGTVGHREQKRVVFRVHNPGPEPLVITNVHPSCSCISVQFDRSPIAAGAGRDGFADVSFGRGFGNFHKQIDVVIQGRRDPLTVHLLANFHPGIRTDQLEIVLDGVVGGGGAIPTVVYEIRSVTPKGPPPEVTQVAIGNSEHVTAKILEPGRERVRIEVGIAPEHPEGRIQAELTAQVNGRLVVVPIRGTVYRGIRLDPPQVNFNVVKTPEDHVERIDLIPVDDLPFQIEAIRYIPRTASLAISPRVEKVAREGGGWTLILTLDPEQGAQGGFGGTLVVDTDHPDKLKLEITVFGHLQ